MIPAWDYAQVCRQLGHAFRYRYPGGEVGSIRMVGLLFAPAEVRWPEKKSSPALTISTIALGITSTSSALGIAATASRLASEQ